MKWKIEYDPGTSKETIIVEAETEEEAEMNFFTGTNIIEKEVKTYDDAGWTIEKVEE